MDLSVGSCHVSNFYVKKKYYTWIAETEYLFRKTKNGSTFNNTSILYLTHSPQKVKSEITQRNSARSTTVGLTEIIWIFSKPTPLVKIPAYERLLAHKQNHQFEYKFHYGYTIFNIFYRHHLAVSWKQNHLTSYSYISKSVGYTIFNLFIDIVSPSAVKKKPFDFLQLLLFKFELFIVTGIWTLHAPWH
jgi:hypothetical protein